MKDSRTAGAAVLFSIFRNGVPMICDRALEWCFLPICEQSPSVSASDIAYVEKQF